MIRRGISLALILYFFFSAWSQIIWTQKSNFPSLERDDAAAFSIGNAGYMGRGGSPVKGFKVYAEGIPSGKFGLILCCIASTIF